MKKLAIIGHPKEGNKVIEILKMLGGKNEYDWECKNPQLAYYIDDDTGRIEFINICNPNENILRYTLEEFLEKYPYKVGDTVITNDGDKFIGTITDIRWQGDSFFVGKEEGDIVYTVQVSSTGGQITYQKEQLQPYKEETFGECIEKTINECLFEGDEDTMEKEKTNWATWDLPDGYEFQDKEGNVINTDVIRLVKKQPKYPKTYKECCEVLGLNTMANDAQGYRADLIICFQELLIARNAYWEIAGEEMGLGKPWEPDFKDDSDKYFICYLKDEVWKSNIKDCNRFLVFPTEKIRDEFYENFKDSIKTCKNLI